MNLFAHLTRFTRAAAFTFAPVFAVSALGCASEADGDDGSTISEDELRQGKAEQWLYNGTLPHLEEPSVTVSLTAHTARVTGYLPAGHETPLPYYADSVQEGRRTKIAVVYPIATGESVNSQGSSYFIERITPWAPSNEKATWGGFPFVRYNRGIAFHGPITAQDGQWKLVRGPVSHGCNRMQGEHVVELSHLVGVDMTYTIHEPQELDGFKVPVTILRAPDEWRGQLVDVDYPATRDVARPTGSNVKMFKSWSADELATFVCPLDRSTVRGELVVDGDYCLRRHKNAFDPAVGPRR